jgi:hypothetical protein
VIVSMETPKVTFTKKAAVTQPAFTIEAPFSSWSSFSLLWGERCKNRPTTVIITAERNGKALGVSKLDFKRNTIPSGLLEYTLRRKAVIDASGIQLQAKARDDGSGQPPSHPRPSRPSGAGLYGRITPRTAATAARSFLVLARPDL